MRGKWAQGIVPRKFCWVIKNSLAICERPGGFGESHRSVRRQEETIWIRENNFDVVISLLANDDNVKIYEKHGVRWVLLPFGGSEEGTDRLVALFKRINNLLEDGSVVLLHREEVGDEICGLIAAYLLWRDLVATGPRAIEVTEQLLERQLGSPGREFVELIEAINQI
tara:strand:- start:52 stop:555 length:504 start_codon:yes stop_codon:yes gene_type:complete